MTFDIESSNSLADLAAEIRAEHDATIIALKAGLEHAMKAGDLLHSAKAKIPHGQWANWLKKNCPSAAFLHAQRSDTSGWRGTGQSSKPNTTQCRIWELQVPSLSSQHRAIPLDMQMVDRAVESLSLTEDIEEALASTRAAGERKPLLDDACAAFAKVNELLQVRPSLAPMVETIAEQII